MQTCGDNNMIKKRTLLPEWSDSHGHSSFQHAFLSRPTWEENQAKNSNKTTLVTERYVWLHLIILLVLRLTCGLRSRHWRQEGFFPTRTLPRSWNCIKNNLRENVKLEYKLKDTVWLHQKCELEKNALNNKNHLEFGDGGLYWHSSWSPRMSQSLTLMDWKLID